MIPRVEDILDAERQMLEEAEIEGNRCFDCARSYIAEDSNQSETFLKNIGDKIGFCPELEMFITDEDTDVSEECEAFLP